MKSVLISIQPKWCELIANGKKRVEVRKTKPKLETPFKCYIYCTGNKQGTKDLLEIHGTDGKIRKANGKVIGEFVCDQILEFENSMYEPAFQETSVLSCVDYEDLALYLGNKDYGYGWHISKLVIYDKPRELSEFIKPCPTPFECDKCEDLVENFGCGRTITRPPQSWCYVESECDHFCDAYCGVACVDGSCPQIENKQYHCVNCWLYKGCKDCCFEGNVYYCSKEGRDTNDP